MRLSSLFTAALMGLTGARASNHHDLSHARALLVARTTVDPKLVCGDGFADCNNGFCCKSGGTCGTAQSVPICKVGDKDYAAALPYDSNALAAAQTALSYVVASITAPTSSATPTPSSTSTSSPASTTSSSSSQVSSTPLYTYSYSANATSTYATAAFYPTGGVTGTNGVSSFSSGPTAAASPSIKPFDSGAERRGAGVAGLVGAVGMGLLLLW